MTIQEANYGPDDARLAMNLNNLALLQTDRGAWREADKLLARTARIEAQAHGPDSPELVLTLENHAAVLDQLDRRDEAEAARHRAAAIRLAAAARPAEDGGPTPQP